MKRDKRQLSMIKKIINTPPPPGILNICTKTLGLTPMDDIVTTVDIREVPSIAVSSKLMGLPALVFTNSE